MLKGFKYTMISLITIILLVVIGIFILTSVINPNRFKPLIAKQVYQSTGRQLIFQGDLHWSLFPLGFQANKVSLTNPPGFKANGAPGNLLNLDYIDWHIKLWPLFWGKVESSVLVVKGLTLHLITTTIGKTNWVFPEAKAMNRPSLSQRNEPLATKFNDSTPSTQSLPSLPSKPNPSADFQFFAPVVKLENIKVIWDDRKNNQHTTIDNLNITATHVNNNKPFPINISFRINHHKPTLVGELQFAAKAEVNFANQYLALRDIDLQGQFKGGDLANKTITTHLNGDLIFADHIVRLEKIVAMLDGHRLRGHLTVNYKPSLAIDFFLNISRFDLDPYLASLTKSSHKTNVNKVTNHANVIQQKQPIGLQANAPSSVNDRVKQTKSSGVATIKTVKLHGKLTIGQLRAMKANLQNLSVTVNGQQGVFRFSPIRFNLYQGRYNGDLVLDTRQPQWVITTNSQIQSIEVQNLLNDIYNFDRLFGTMNAQAMIKTYGRDRTTLMNNLAGRFRFSVRNGKLRGVNIGYYINTLASLLNKKIPPLPSGENVTPFHSITGSGVIQRGVVSSNDLQLVSPMIQVNGKAQANLNNKQVKAKLYTKQSTRQLSSSLPQLPINVSGQLGNVKVSPDYQYVASHFVKQQLQDTLVKKVVPSSNKQANLSSSMPAPIQVLQQTLFSKFN